MKILIPILALSVLASPAAAADRSIHNFGDVLDKGKANFRALCTKQKGKLIDTGDPTMLRCDTHESAAAYVMAEFAKGKAVVWGTIWLDASEALSLISLMRKEYGPEDSRSTDENGCVQRGWVPGGSGLVYLVGMCADADMTSFIVGFQ